MTLAINSKTYTANSFQKDAVVYSGPNHTVSNKDSMKLARVAPKPVGDFSGVGRTSSKLTRTHTLTGALTPSGDLIVNIDVAVPVGTNGTDVDTALNDLGAYVASAAYKTLVKAQLINY